MIKQSNLPNFIKSSFNIQRHDATFLPTIQSLSWNKSNSCTTILSTCGRIGYNRCYKISLLRTNDMIIAPMKQPFHNFLLITCKSSSLSTPCNPSSTLMTVLITRFPSSHLDQECLMTMVIPLDSWLMTVRYRFRNIALLSANNSLHNKSSSIIQGHRAHGIPTKHLQ